LTETSASAFDLPEIRSQIISAANDLPRRLGPLSHAKCGEDQETEVTI